MNKEINVKKESSVIEIVEFIKKYGANFNVLDKNTIEVSMKSGNTKVFYLDESGTIIGSAEFLNE